MVVSPLQLVAYDRSQEHSCGGLVSSCCDGLILGLPPTPLDPCLPGRALPPSLLHLMDPGSFLSVEKTAPNQGQGPSAPWAEDAAAVVSQVSGDPYVVLRVSSWV